MLLLAEIAPDPSLGYGLCLDCLNPQGRGGPGRHGRAPSGLAPGTHRWPQSGRQSCPWANFANLAVLASWREVCCCAEIRCPG